MTARLAGTLGRRGVADFEWLVQAEFEAARAANLSALLDVDRRFRFGLLRRAVNQHVVGVVDVVSATWGSRPSGSPAAHHRWSARRPSCAGSGPGCALPP
jgi:DNA-binding GntR family transcriptional regulator